MTNDELNSNEKMIKKRWCLSLSFGFRDSFVIRHSSFSEGPPAFTLTVGRDLFLLQRVIERLLQIELFDFLSQPRIVCCIQDLWVLQEIEKTALCNHVGYFRVLSQGNDLWVLTQFMGAGKAQEPLGAVRVGN